MTDTTKVTCPDCGGEYANLGVHKRFCKGEQAATPEPAPEPVKEDATQPEKKAISPNMNPQVRERIERALKADAARSAAPEAYVDNMGKDERRMLINQYCPELLDESSEWSEYWGDPKDESRDSGRGCIPVINEHGEQVQHGGDLLYRRRRRDKNLEIHAASAESKARLGDTDMVVDDKTGGHQGGSMGNIDDSSLARVTENTVRVSHRGEEPFDE